MLTQRPCKSYCQSALFSTPWKLQRLRQSIQNVRPNKRQSITRPCSTSSGNNTSATENDDKKSERRSFLTIEEAGLVEISGLDAHERFLCRLTISSLNLLRVVSEQEGCSIEELNAGKICDWFIKDKLKREQNVDSAVLQWDDSGFNL